MKSRIIGTVLFLLLVSALVATCGGSDRGARQRTRMSRAQLAIGANLLLRHDEKSALTAFDRAIAANPADYDAYVIIAGLLMREQKYAAGIRYMERGLNRPRGVGDASNRAMDRLRDSELYVSLGDLHSKLGSVEKAEDSYRQAIRLNGNNASAYNNWGYMYADAGAKLGEALRLTRRAVDLDPDNGYYLDSVGWTYFKMGDTKRALQFMIRAVTSCPSEAELRFHLAMVHEKAGHAGAAMVEYGKTLRLSPGNSAARGHLQYLYQRATEEPEIVILLHS